MSARLSTFAAAMVVARRDFTAILFSRSFFFFLLGPLFPVLIGAMAGGIGQKVQQSADNPRVGIAMAAPDVAAMKAAHQALELRMEGGLPDLVVLRRLAPGESFDARKALGRGHGNIAAVITGSPAAPHLTGTPERIAQWRGPVSLLAAQALGRGPKSYPQVALTATATSNAQEHHDRILTAQTGQMLLFLLTMLLAGMVLSNLVEEKSNKIIEILAAAIPMDAVFLGKLFAMLAVSLVGIAVWGLTGVGFLLFAGHALPDLPEPAVGWPLFLAFGLLYFTMAYLLMGALFLTIGSMAATVREVQTLSMPVTFLQIVFFFLASYAVAEPGGTLEKIATVVPFSSPFAMLAQAAMYPSLWPHVAALTWQVACVALIIRTGARLFRTRVMKSGPAGRVRGRGARRQPRPARS
jgi:ABC-2 type transport system permease protein